MKYKYIKIKVINIIDNIIDNIICYFIFLYLINK